MACALLAFTILPLARIESAQAQTPWRLELVGGWGGHVSELERVGDLGILVAGQRLVMLDMSDLTDPAELGSLSLGGPIQDIAIRDSLAYVSIQNSHSDLEIAVVDFGDPTHPQMIWHDGMPSFNTWGEIHAYEDALYVGLSSDPFVYDISTPTSPRLVGELEFFPCRVGDIVDSHMYAAYAGPYFEIDDLSNPFAPAFVKSMQIDDLINQLHVEGGIAYLLTDDGDRSYLRMLDVTDPTDPQQIGSFLVADLNQPDNLGGDVSDLAVSNGMVYIAVRANQPRPDKYEQAQGLVILDATDPANITLLGKYKTRGSITGVRIDPKDSGIAYVFDQGEGLIILDVSNPADPVRIGSYYSPGSMPKMVRDGDRLYVSDQWMGFSILDVSEPATPTLVGAYQTREEAIAGGNWQIDVKGSLAALSTGWAGFEIVDVSDPANPTFAGAFDPWPEGVQAGGLRFNPTQDGVLHVGTQPGGYLVNFDYSDLDNVFDFNPLFLDGGQPFFFDMESTTDGTVLHLINEGPGLQAVGVENVKEDPPTLLSKWKISNGPYMNLMLQEEGGQVRRYVNTDDPQTNTFVQDVTDPAAPGDIVVFGWGGTGLAIDGDRLFTGRVSGILSAWSIEDRFAPFHLGDASTDHAPGSHYSAGTDLAAMDGHVFLCDFRIGNQPPLQLRSSGFMVFEMICPNDFNGDGSLNILDFVAYQNAFVSQDENADINGDGMLNILDFVAFQEIYQTGCP
jgi:hypothetical protein